MLRFLLSYLAVASGMIQRPLVCSRCFSSNHFNKRYKWFLPLTRKCTAVKMMLFNRLIQNMCHLPGLHILNPFMASWHWVSAWIAGHCDFCQASFVICLVQVGHSSGWLADDVRKPSPTDWRRRCGPKGLQDMNCNRSILIY